MSSTNDTNIIYGQYNVPPAEDFVKFGVGQPSTDMLPLDLIKEHGIAYINSLTNKSMLQYGSIRGYNEFLKDLALYLSEKYNTEVNEKELFITNGVTDAITTLCSLLSYKNPLVLVEDPTYFLAKDIFSKDFKFNIESIKMESDGMNMDDLAKTLQNNKDKTIILYTIPTFHNPTSYTMSDKKRKQLATLVDMYYNVYVFADEVYQLLYFNDDNKPPLPLCYYSDKIVSLGSFSKILAPSIRMGWIQTKNKEIMELLVNAGRFDSSGGNTPFIQALIHGILKSNALDRNILSCRKFLSQNCEALSQLAMEKLGKYMTFMKPNGGYFLWLKLKHPLIAQQLVDNAEQFNIHFHAGNRFSINPKNNHIRLSFSYYAEGDFKTGVERLEQLCDYLVQNQQHVYDIGMIGYNGRLGSLISTQLNNHNMNITNIGRDLNTDIKNCNALIDVSSAEGTRKLVNYLLENNLNIPLVVGTTGHSIEDLNLLKSYSDRAPVALISNFSQGIPLFLNLIDYINTDDWDVSITEKHHSDKKDSPSGTALSLLKKINKEVYMKSIRGDNIVGEHKLKLTNECEELSIEHIAKDRMLFAVGAIRYIYWIMEQPVGFYTSMNTQIKFSKYTACGNDFIMIEEKYSNIASTKPDFIQTICERRKNIGADGVIFLTHDKTDLHWTYFNSDGSGAKMCGNGTRCVVQYALDNNWIKNDNTCRLINSDFIQIVIFKNDQFYVVMPYATQCKSDEYLNCNLVNIGVKHMVHMFEDINDDLFNDLKFSDYKHKSLTKEPYNINLYKVNKDGKIRIRTFENGVNEETLACGTGCCAVAYLEWEKRNHKVIVNTFEVITKSNDIIKVNIDHNGTILLSGPAKKVYSGSY